MLAEATLAAQRQMAADIYAIEMANEQAHERQRADHPGPRVRRRCTGEPAATTRMPGTSGGTTRSATAIRHPPSRRSPRTSRPQYQPYSVTTCFAAGTPVHTLDGARPIEAIQVGDQVLSQDAATGALSFQPVVFVHRNPPGKTLRITLSDGESVVCSVYHRFWRANLGWAQARELKPGDTLRTLGGIVRVDSVEPDSVQPLYNLDVAGSRTFFAGRTSLLVHDNTLPDHRLKPFDALPVVEVTPRPE